MAPKKKVKLGGAAGPATRNDRVPAFLMATKNFVNELFDVRHATADTAKKKNPAPFLHGGSFKLLAQRAWKDPAKLLMTSKNMIEAAGICDADLTMEAFGDLFLRMKAIVSANISMTKSIFPNPVLALYIESSFG
jgi:hypothetical protein